MAKNDDEQIRKAPGPKPVAGELAIDCHNVTRRFGDFTAVNNLTLQVKKGELFGFLGPNGAGKTTTIKMFTTLIPLSGGSAKVAGFDLLDSPAQVRSRIGVVPQQFALFEELTPMENLWYIGELFDMERTLIRARSEELLKIANLYDKRDVVSAGFSGGMKQRLSVAASLLHTPEILFMDEPTTGLDPQSRIALRELTTRLNRMGITIIYTTHDMDEADKLCDRIAIMDHGHLIALGTPAELKTMGHRPFKIVIGLESASPALLDELKRVAGTSSGHIAANTIFLEIRALHPGLTSDLTTYLHRKGHRVRSFAVQEPTLEDIFISITKKDLRD